jgi:hypothetical protein
MDSMALSPPPHRNTDTKKRKRCDCIDRDSPRTSDSCTNKTLLTYMLIYIWLTIAIAIR